MVSEWKRTPVARKEYRCSWCFERIEKGEKHTYSWILDGRDGFHLRTHSDCDAAAQRSWDESGAMDGEPFCDERHQRGKSCSETKCGNY